LPAPAAVRQRDDVAQDVVFRLDVGAKAGGDVRAVIRKIVPARYFVISAPCFF
jgi:hypothetical protein